jgi:Zn-dependent protease
MGWSLSIGSIAGTAIRVHITFLLFLVWIFIASYVSGGADAAWTGLVFIVLLFACVETPKLRAVRMCPNSCATTQAVRLRRGA